ncbi:alpha/beta hydrolase [Nocardia arthritidis]|uniref:Esterase family protein n=1 Tax=Nocardia arthritidis TaxID=228602 RepID=A0A6G9YLW2_9NOCA|nr:alpha/beta hydrolase family protein [Nocardia arthritidis]QIS14057.1 esterase family protein [Nocardia arthritidis]
MRLRACRRVAAAALATVAVATSLTIDDAVATADPIITTRQLLGSPITADGSKIVEGVIRSGNSLGLLIYSAAMDKQITVEVQRPADASVPRPTLYLLNGAGGGTDLATWRRNTDVGEFLADKNVNVVQPVGGAWSYYTDWLRDDPKLGRNRWKTFFLEELPPLIDAALGTNGVNAIAGLSMAGTSVLALAEARPGLYRSVASYSGCAQTSDPLGKRAVRMAVDIWGGGNSANMWGADDNPLWSENDPYLHADKLRGVNLFISSGTGIPGPYDRIDDPHLITPGPAALLTQILLGGVIEASTNMCTHNLQNRLNQLGIPATYDFTPTGTHSWGYWQDAFKKSWPVLADGLDIHRG